MTDPGVITQFILDMQRIGRKSAEVHDLVRKISQQTRGDDAAFAQMLRDTARQAQQQAQVSS